MFQLDNIAALARKLEDWELADSSAQKMMEHDPSYAGSHYALGFIAEHKGESAAAHEQFTVADKLWAKADPGVAPQLKQH